MSRRFRSLGLLFALVTAGLSSTAFADEDCDHGRSFAPVRGDYRGGEFRGEFRGDNFRGEFRPPVRPMPVPVRDWGFRRHDWRRERMMPVRVPAPACGFYDQYGRFMPYRYDAYGNLVACNPAYSFNR